LSRIIKSSSYSTVGNKRVIEHPVQAPAEPEDTMVDGDAPLSMDAQVSTEVGQIIRQAQEQAEHIIQDAVQQTEQTANESRQEIEWWWEQRRQEDEAVRAEVQEQAFQQGLELGKEEGQRMVYEEYSLALEQARAILEEAPVMKRKVIGEAESFVLDLTLGIARKIIGEQLVADKENLLALIRKALSETQEYKSLSVAVSPDAYEYVQENRGKLLEVLDSQIEMLIVPDESITAGGCVVRTSLGSVDARVDTQLEEIKKALADLTTNGSE
jgi:flagellar assembly protein FliH